MNILRLSFYDFCIEIKSSDTATLEDIKLDFSFFITEKIKAQVSFEIFAQSPDYKDLPLLKASFYTPRNICYRDGDISFIDYFGKGLTIIDCRANTYKIYSSDPQLRHEIVFLSILSLVGQNLDSRGMHRIHALGIEAKARAALVLLPSGGGKTTLLLELMKNKELKLVSEDSPLVNSSGKILPFPLRIGVSYPDKPEGIPEDCLHLIERMEFGKKYIISLEYLKGRISRNALTPQFIICGLRCLGPHSEILPLSKYKALKELIKNSVIGVGLYQGLEFLLQQGLSGLFKESGVILSRLKNSFKIVSRAQTYLFVVGCDRKKNAETILKFLLNSKS